MATGLRTQSELCPSACMVELPSKPHNGSCSSVGKLSNALICVLPRKLGVGVYPSSQMYSSLYFVIGGFSEVDGTKTLDDAEAAGGAEDGGAGAGGGDGTAPGGGGV